MSSVRVLRNAHHVLGLPTGVDLAQIRQRANHLINLARIEETETYATDIPGVKGLRSEENVRKALEQLTNIKSRFLETFFWFELTTIQDQESLRKIIESNFDGAISYWHGLSATAPNWLAKKNEALAGYIATYQTANVVFFERSLNLWREIGVSEQFWEYYKRHYELTDDLGTNASLFSESRNMLSEYLSWLAVDLFRKHNDPSIVRAFFKETGVIGMGIENHILSPTVLRIRSQLDTLRETLALDKMDAMRLRTGKVALEDTMAQLSAFGVDNYSPIKVLRDQCASTFRSISIKAHNDWNDMNVAKEFHGAASLLVTSESSKAQMKLDSDQLSKNEEWNRFTAAFNEGMKKEDPIHNYFLFCELEGLLRDESRQEAGFLNMKRVRLINYVIEEFDRSKTFVDQKNFSEAEAGLNKVQNALRRNIELFSFNTENLFKMMSELADKMKKVTNRRELPVVERSLAEVKDMGNNTKWAGGDETRIAFIVLGQATIWLAIVPLLKELNKPKKLFGIF